MKQKILSIKGNFAAIDFLNADITKHLCLRFEWGH